MENLEIKINSPNLLVTTQKFDFNNPQFDIEEFSIKLCELMWKEKCLGLAANQVGYNSSIFAIIGEPESFVCINPKIVHTFEEIVELEETSLSYPGLVFEKKRPKSIRFRFQAPNAEFFTKVFTGLTARIIQQMMDHLNGVPIWDGISKLRWDMAVAKAKKNGFDYSNLTFKKSSIII